MFVGLSVSSPPAVEPVALATAKQHCRVDQDYDDNLITTYIQVAREMAEGYLGRALITQTLVQTFAPELPYAPNRQWQKWRGPFTMLRNPVQSIGAVTVLDIHGNSTTIPAGDYTVSPAVLGYQIDTSIEPARLRIDPQLVLTKSADGIGGQALDVTAIQHVQVEYVAGYGAAAADVPNTIINAILLQVAFLYEHRGDAPAEFPPAVERLLNFRRLNFLG